MDAVVVWLVFRRYGAPQGEWIRSSGRAIQWTLFTRVSTLVSYFFLEFFQKF
jgi:hypothetical protein